MLFVMLRNSFLETRYNPVAVAQINQLINASYDYKECNYREIIELIFDVNSIEKEFIKKNGLNYQKDTYKISLGQKNLSVELDLNMFIASYHPEISIYERKKNNEIEIVIALKSWLNEVESIFDYESVTPKKVKNSQVEFLIKIDEHGKTTLFISGAKHDHGYKNILCSEFKYGKIQIVKDLSSYGSITIKNEKLEVLEKDGYFYSILKFKK